MRLNTTLEKLQHKGLRLINNYYLKFIEGEERPAFYNVKDICPELLEFDKNVEVIQKELSEILYDKNEIPKYYEIDEVQSYISGKIHNVPEKKGEAWKVFMLYLMGENLKENQSLCPETTKILKKIPNVFQAFFSVLEGGKPILSHKGPFLGYLRYHLGLKVPKHNPPTLRVLNDYYTWEEGKSMMFDDTLDHEVLNDSDDIRVILIVDIMRPLPLFAHCINWMVIRFIIRHLYGNKLITNLKRFKKRNKQVLLKGNVT